MDVLELLGGEAFAPRDLGDDLVAAPLDAEAVHVVAPEHGAEVATGLAQVDPLRAHLVAVEHDLGLRLVELEVGVGEEEKAALERLGHELVRDVRELLGLGGGSHHEVHGKVAGAGERRGRARDHAHPGNRRELPGRLHQELRGGPLPLAPGLRHHPPEAASRGRDLEGAPGLGEAAIHVVVGQQKLNQHFQHLMILATLYYCLSKVVHWGVDKIKTAFHLVKGLKLDVLLLIVLLQKMKVPLCFLLMS